MFERNYYNKNKIKESTVIFFNKNDRSGSGLVLKKSSLFSNTQSDAKLLNLCVRTITSLRTQI